MKRKEEEWKKKKTPNKNAISKFFYVSTACGISSLFFLFLSLQFTIHFNCNELGVDKVTRSLTSFWQYNVVLRVLLYTLDTFFAGERLRVQFYVYGKNLFGCVIEAFVFTKAQTLSWLACGRFISCSPISSIWRYFFHSSHWISEMSSSVKATNTTSGLDS